MDHFEESEGFKFSVGKQGASVFTNPVQGLCSLTNIISCSYLIK